MKKTKGLRLLALVLAFTMLVPNAAYAAKANKGKADQNLWEDSSQDSTTMESESEVAAAEEKAVITDTLEAALAEAKAYIDELTINSSSNDPATVVSQYKTHFTWDNEKRENGKSYLYDWSYYNGVVFEGIEYVYDETKEDKYGDYVEEYMSSMITSNGTWAKCANNSSKECAGYDATHGADCYKTASLLLDLYERTDDNRYLTMAGTLYADLDNAAKTYLLKNAGNNYRHTWSSDPSPDLWLDGLYMILPFRAEYAKHINDTEELDLIVDRMQWVSDNMYNGSKGIFYHAADSASSNSGTHWLRSIGWYAAAIVDIMDSMEGKNLEAMKAQLVKLVDGMKACQNTGNGMWLNNMNAKQSSTNPYETSGTALTCYAVMKAVNEGWLNESYADMAILAFKGICEEKLDGNNLTDICFKGTPGSSNSTFYDNEGKGVGPFIMLYAEVLEYVNDLAEEKPGTPDVEEPSDQEVTVENTTIKVGNVTNLVAEAVKEDDKTVIETKEYTNFVAFDVSATLAEGAKAMISIPVPAEWSATEDELVGISVEDGEVKEIKGTLSEDGVYSFEVDHFSAKGVAYQAAPVAEEAVYSGTGNLVGKSVYTLDNNGVDYGSDNKYLIVGSGNNAYALTANGSNTGVVAVTIKNNTITLDTNEYEWYFTTGLVNTGNTTYNTFITQDGTTWLYHTDSNMYVGNGADAHRGYWYVEKKNDKNDAKQEYRITDQDNSNWRLYYNNNNNKFTVRTNNDTYVRLFKQTSSTAADTVTFAINPVSGTLFPNDTLDLNGTVTVAGTQVNLSDCTIAWASVNENVATVADGIVTGIADGTTYITATLSAVNEKELQNNITLRIPVTVQSRTIVDGSEILTGNDPITTKRNVEPDFGNIKLTVTYDDGTTGVITVDNGLVIEGYDITTIGYVYATISYNEKQYGTVRVTVEGNPYEGLDSATEYPEYPADGAVRIDKTASANADTFKNTGVTHVELDVAGISVKQGVNVILISDISNSMSWDDEKLDYNDTEVKEETNQRLNISKASAKSFVKEFLKDNTGASSDNTFTLLAFAGIDGDYNTHNTAKDNDDVYQLGDLAMTEIEKAEAAINRLVKATTGGTNYDYAFQQAHNLAQQLYGLNGKEVYIVFMTDGVPTHYNGVYYKSRNNTDLTARMQYVDPSTGAVSAYTSTGNDRNGNDIDSTATQQITVYHNDGTTENKTVTYNKGWSDYVTGNLNGWAEKVKDLDYVKAVYSVGFGMKNGSVTQGATTSMPTLPNVNGGSYYLPSSTTQTLLKTIATTEEHFFEADNAEELKNLYESLATKIKYAGTSAQVTDIIDNDFTLQMAATSGSGEKTATLSRFGITPKITVTAYDLYTKAETTDTLKIGTRKGTYEVFEEVTFNEPGTEAYSNKIENSTENIMSTASDGTVTIEAHYFTYTKTPEGVETFKWLIGNITDKEIALGFDVYLKESLEGGAPEDIYYTNKEATIEYIDINDKYATQTFPVPAVSWGGASTTIRFYLVNEKGEPVNRNGDVVPMANCIYVGNPVAVNINLNADATIDAQKIEAAAYVPAEYFLYDIDASYTIQTASGDDNSIVGGITPSIPSADASKTAGGKVQTGAQTTIVIEYEETYYTYSTVGFGVRYDLSIEETLYPLVNDKIVIDYGKTVQVDVLANDPTVEGYDRKLTGFVVFNANTDTSIKQLNAGAATYTSSNGLYSIVDQKVAFKLNKMLSSVEKVFYVVEYTNISNEEDFYYLFGELDIIPATNVYYETNFANVFNLVTTGEEWTTKTVSGDSESASDSVQNVGTIGVDQTYGYDTTYTDDAYLSDGSSLFVIGQGIKLKDTTADYTYAQFEFTGTGFELISRTGAEQGAIRVDIYSDASRTTRVKSVTVLNKSESNLELYQIPVVSVNDLTYATYYVTVGVNAAYTNETYPALSRGGEFYFDAIRIYDPVKGNSQAESAYARDNEANPELYEVRQMLIGAGDADLITNGVQGVSFIDRTQKDALITDYATIGPNNEVYIAKGNAIAFKIDWNDAIAPTSVDIGAKAITGDTAHMKVYISGAAEKATSPIVDTDIASSTVEFYELVNAANMEEFSESGAAYVVVENTGDGVLSITDIKVANSTKAAVSEVEFFVDEPVMMFARAVFSFAGDVEEKPDTEVEVPETPEEPDTEVEVPETPEVVPNYDILSAELSSTTVKRNSTVILTAKTTEDVVSVDVVIENVKKAEPGKPAPKAEKNKDVITVKSVETVDGMKVWTIEVKVVSKGDKTITLTGYGADGTSGAPATTGIKIKLP